MSAIEVNAHVPTGRDEMVYTCEIGSLSKRDHAVAGALFNPNTDSGNERYGYQIRDQPYVHRILAFRITIRWVSLQRPVLNVEYHVD